MGGVSAALARLVVPARLAKMCQNVRALPNVEGGEHGLINTTLLARPGTRNSLGLSSCGLIHVY